MAITINGTTGIAGVDGSAGTPAIQGSDSNTGIFFPAADTIAFAEGGVEAMRIDSSGNVGIGTSSPGAKLDVNGPASVTSFTGTTRLGITVRGSSGATDYSGIDFIGNNQTNPLARIAVLSTGGGSTLSFGTSNIYANGITNTAVSIDPTGVFAFNSGYGSAATAYGCRAWVNFNGTGTVAIRASGNVTSITDNGTGNYTVNFTTAMPDANYSTTGTARSSGVSNGMSLGTITPATSSVNVGTTSGSANVSLDTSEVCVAIFR